MKVRGRPLTAAVATVFALAGCTVFALAGCTGGSPSEHPSAARPASGGVAVAAPGTKFAVVTNGSAGDAFWNAVRNGAEQAGKEFGIAVTYQGSDRADQQARLIGEAVTDRADGLVVSLADPDALADAIGKAVAAGIPVITINSGQDRSAGLGALTHVGQDETVAGQGAGMRLAGEGVRHLLCVTQETDGAGLLRRCAGARQALAGGTTENLPVPSGDVAADQKAIATKLRQDSSIDGVLTLNTSVAVAAVDAVAATGAKAKVATFDISNKVVEAIIAGKVSFAVDQQPYEQGYLPVVMLHLYLMNANTVGGGRPVLTGPGFVTRENAARVKDLAAKGTR